MSFMSLKLLFLSSWEIVWGLYLLRCPTLLSNCLSNPSLYKGAFNDGVERTKIPSFLSSLLILASIFPSCWMCSITSIHKIRSYFS